MLCSCTGEGQGETDADDIRQEGDIKLSLQKGDYGKYFVSLMYYGKINTDAVRSSAIDDL